MHKLWITTLLLLGLSSFLTAQTGALYGLDDEARLVRVNPETGQATVLSTTSVAPNGFLVQQTQADGTNDRYFLIALDENEQPRLRAVDLNSGETVSDAPFTADVFSSITYACPENLFFGLNETVRLASVDPETGEITNVSTADLPITSFTDGSGAVDTDDDRFFIYGALADGTPRLLTLDLQTGAILASPQVPQLPPAHLGPYYCETGRLYALSADFQRLGYLDPETAEFTVLSTADLGLSGIIGNDHALDEARGVYTLVGIDLNGDRRLYSIDVNTGELLYTPQLADDNRFSEIAYANQCEPVAEFTPGSTCADEAVPFDNTSFGTTFEWNFGDPESGDDNTSTERFPQHQFSAPGTYTVRLIAGYCGRTDSVEVEITVSERPEFELPTEFDLCTGDSLLLDVTTPGAAYEWQDGSTGATFQVLEEGTYTVDVDVNGCLTLLTTDVREVECPCVLEMPNAFTPNEDGDNDRFNAVNENCDFTEYRLRIYSRWGELVYDSTDPDLGWDGRVNGNDAPSDVYVFTLEYGFLDEEGTEMVRMEKGEMVLLR